MAKVKGYKSDSIVLTYKNKHNKKVQVSAQTFRMHNYIGVTVTGEAYYVEQAIGLGAKKE